MVNFECSKNSSIDRTNSSDHRDRYWDRILDLSEGYLSGSYENLIEAQAAYKCQSLYRSAFAAVYAEYTVTNQLNGFLTSLKTVGNTLNNVYVDLFDYALRLNQLLVDILCILEDLFDLIDFIIATYSNCGFIGDAYETIKLTLCRR